MKESGFFFGSDVKTKDLGGGCHRRVLAHNKNIMMVQVLFEKGATGSVHTHVHTQCTLIKEGVFEFSIDGEKKIVREGDSLVFDSMEPHGCVCLEKGSVIDVFTPEREDFL